MIIPEKSHLKHISYFSLINSSFEKYKIPL